MGGFLARLLPANRFDRSDGARCASEAGTPTDANMLATEPRQDGCGEMQTGGGIDMSKACCWTEIMIFGVVFLPSAETRPALCVGCEHTRCRICHHSTREEWGKKV